MPEPPLNALSAAALATADILFTNRAREAFNAAGQLALRNSQPEFGVFHLAFVLFDARALLHAVEPHRRADEDRLARTVWFGGAFCSWCKRYVDVGSS